MKEKFKFLEDLVLASSPSSCEAEAIKVWNEACFKINGTTHIHEDALGNSVWTIGSGPCKVLISAHIDTVCGRVSKITDKGTLMFNQSAGICLKSLISGNVMVCTDTEKIPGVVQKVALHLDGDRGKVGDFLDYRINIGAKNKKEVEDRGIYPGCIIMYKPEINTNFGSGFICGTGLDDKAGMWIVYDTLRLLQSDIPAKYTIAFGACTQEETGLNGAKRVARNMNPNISIDIDCTFADTELVGKDYKDLDINLGDGALIAYGPEKSSRICKLLRDVAEDRKIKSRTYTTRAGGTNTKAFQDFSFDCETALLSYGLLSMHSSNEIVCKDDLIACRDLLVGILKEELL